MVVSKNDELDRLVGHFADVIQKAASHAGRGPGVDDDNVVVTHYEAAVGIEGAEVPDNENCSHPDGVVGRGG